MVARGRRGGLAGSVLPAEVLGVPMQLLALLALLAVVSLAAGMLVAGAL